MGTYTLKMNSVYAYMYMYCMYVCVHVYPFSMYKRLNQNVNKLKMKVLNPMCSLVHPLKIAIATDMVTEDENSSEMSDSADYY